MRKIASKRTNTAMRVYQRRLPHWDAVSARVFVTFRLYGSLPVNRVFPPARITAGETFVAMDRVLDRGETGPVYLRQPEIAGMVVQSIFDGDRAFRRYDLHALVVMPNHVHLLVTSRVRLADWVRSLKGFAGHSASRMLGLNGAPFWQDESYDRLVRDDDEAFRIRRYIEWNPVKAGLCLTPEEFPWSSGTPCGSPAAGRKP